jgi:hypothetical protein
MRAYDDHRGIRPSDISDPHLHGFPGRARRPEAGCLRGRDNQPRRPTPAQKGKLKTLEGELTAAKEAKAKAEQAQKEAEAKLKALEAKPASKTPEDAKPAPK